MFGMDVIEIHSKNFVKRFANSKFLNTLSFGQHYYQIGRKPY